MKPDLERYKFAILNLKSCNLKSTFIPSDNYTRIFILPRFRSPLENSKNVSINPLCTSRRMWNSAELGDQSAKCLSFCPIKPACAVEKNYCLFHVDGREALTSLKASKSWSPMMSSLSWSSKYEKKCVNLSRWTVVKAIIIWDSASWSSHWLSTLNLSTQVAKTVNCIELFTFLDILYLLSTRCDVLTFTVICKNLNRIGEK